MTREEELDWLYRLRSEIYVYMPKEWLIPMNDALDMAIKALKQYGVLQEIRQEIADFEEEVFHEPDTDYKAYASVRYCCDIIDKHIKEIEGRDKE